MGTRNLTAVIWREEVKVAQYGQWDGYPEGQGLTLLGFLSVPLFVEDLKMVLPKVRFENETDRLEKDKFMESIGSKDGWMTMEQAEKYKRRYPLHHRDVGGDILFKLLLERFADEIVVVDAYSFAADSLFCEWAYVVDLDKEIFEVYTGFTKTPLTETDRFFPLQKQDSDFYPVKLFVSFPLADLPEPDDFLSHFK